jgi:hypothetical protein
VVSQTLDPEVRLVNQNSQTIENVEEEGLYLVHGHIVGL